MHRVKRIEVPMFSSMILEIAVTDEMPRIRKRFHLPEETERFYAGVAKTSIYKNGYYFKSVTMILNPNDYPNVITPGVIAHEAIHVKNIIFRDVGQYLDWENDEAEAYLTEWIVETVTNFYNDEDNKKISETPT